MNINHTAKEDVAGPGGTLPGVVTRGGRRTGCPSSRIPVPAGGNPGEDCPRTTRMSGAYQIQTPITLAYGLGPTCPSVLRGCDRS